MSAGPLSRAWRAAVLLTLPRDIVRVYLVLETQVCCAAVMRASVARMRVVRFANIVSEVLVVERAVLCFLASEVTL